MSTETGMSLEKIRAEIDRIDSQIRSLFLRRMEAAAQAAEVKAKTGDPIWKPGREAEILARRLPEVPEEIRAEYEAFLRRTMEVSRAYEYGLIFDRDPEAAERCIGDSGILGEQEDPSVISLRLRLPEAAGGSAALLSVLPSRGYDIISMEKDTAEGTVRLILRGDSRDPAVRKLLFQLSREFPFHPGN